MKHIILRDLIQQKVKPTKSINGQIVERLKQIEAVDEVSIEELANIIKSGQTFTPSYMKSGDDGKCNKAWLSQSIFALDFDNSMTVNGDKVPVPNQITPTQVQERLKNYGLKCCLIYTSFSNTIDWNKFRVIFQVEEVIMNPIDAMCTLLYFKYIFEKEIDEICLSISHHFHGSNKDSIIYIEPNNYLDKALLEIAAIECATKNSSLNNLKRDINNVIKKARKQNKLSENIEIVDYDTFADEMISKSRIEKIKCQSYEQLKEILLQIPLIQDFINTKLDDVYLFRIASNLNHISNGERFYEECLSVNTSYDYPDKIRKIKHCSIRNYNPMNLEPDEIGNTEYNNIVNFVRDNIKKKTLKRLKPLETITPKEAENILKQHFKTAFNSNDKNIHIIKVATGIGKTKILTTLDENESVVIACKTHKLKDELAEEFKNLNKKFMSLLSDESLDDEIKEKLNLNYS